MAFGVKAVVDKNSKPSELDLWNKSLPTTSATPASASQPQPWEHLGQNSDATFGEATYIDGFQYQGIPVGAVDLALGKASQAEVDQIRQVELGYDAPALMDEILSRRGLDIQKAGRELPSSPVTPQKPVDLNQRLGAGNDLTSLDGLRIMVAFAPGSDSGHVFPALKQVMQAEADSIRDGLEGRTPASVVLGILHQHGFS
ncbi:hypothetical protein KIH31_15125 [Paenarthrobacter sp. DKR-5]|nr:hypothetical protein [Paenarthrobacter sp. DKR-5]